MVRNTSRPDLGRGGLLEQLDRYPVTFGVILANVLVFGFCATRSGGFSPNIPSQVLTDLGANHVAYLRSQPWRLVTSAFLHANLLHLGFNCLAMFIVGRLVEIHYGSARTWVIYVACFVGGALASDALQAYRGGGGSVGASAGVLGLILTGYVYASQNPARLGSMAAQLRSWIFVTIIASLFFPGIDHAAHAGGAAIGALFGWRVQPRLGQEAHPAWTWLAHALAILCLACFAMVALTLRRSGMA